VTETGGAVLELRDFRVTFPTHFGDVQAVRGVDFDIGEGELLGVVGESGSGKSVTFLGVMGLLPKSARIEGSAKVGGTELVGASRRLINQVRGKRVAMIFQDPLSALNPVHRIGDQIVEMIQSHQPLGKKAAWEKSVDLLDIVGIPQPRERASQYPHEFSGGMRQRVMIAMAIANDPEVLIADEPTTALDVTVQAQILEVLQRIRREMKTAIVLITHDLGVIARIADRVQVMYAGRVAERGDIGPIFGAPPPPPQHPRPARQHSRARARTPDADPGCPAQHAPTTLGLRLPGALPPRHRRVRRGAARVAPARRPGDGVHPRRGADFSAECLMSRRAAA
jgi:peptide/nickel transport system ATP-binding protein